MIPISKTTTYGLHGTVFGTGELVCPLCGSKDYNLNNEEFAKSQNWGCLFTFLAIAIGLGIALWQKGAFN
jgi:hypothetical protein